MSVVAPAVAAAAARALDERRDPRTVRAADVGLDAGHPGAQAGEAADALEAGVERVTLIVAVPRSESRRRNVRALRLTDTMVPSY